MDTYVSVKATSCERAEGYSMPKPHPASETRTKYE